MNTLIVCPACGEEFDSSEEFLTHVETHKQKKTGLDRWDEHEKRNLEAARKALLSPSAVEGLLEEIEKERSLKPTPGTSYHQVFSQERYKEIIRIVDRMIEDEKKGIDEYSYLLGSLQGVMPVAVEMVTDILTDEKSHIESLQLIKKLFEGLLE